jgi:gliding motility-associated-like protein
MKRAIPIIASLLFAGVKLSAQITITSSDLPNSLDTVRISVNTTLAGFVPAATGANFTWDYRYLVPDSQRVVKCEKASNTAYPLYNFLATYGIYNYNPDQFPFVLIGAAPTDVYDFYKKTSSYLAIVGQGITVSGSPVPALYSNADRVYSLPLNYGNTDSSTSTLSFPIPGMGYYEKKQVRRNVVDGWGTLMTPFGTFNTLRVKTTLEITDSIYLDTIQFGFTIPRQTLHEYKWLAPGGKLPILEVDGTESFFGGLTIDRVNWQDSLIKPMSVSMLSQPSCAMVNEGSLTANVTGGRYPLKYSWSTGDTTATISNLAPGSYTVIVTDRYGKWTYMVDSVKQLNDSSCLILFNVPTGRTCPLQHNGTLSATVTGARLPAQYLWSTGDTTLTISNLAAGSYTLYVTDKYNRKDTAVAVVESRTGDASCLNIPTAFTPDGDGTNDVWNIRSLADFSNCKVEVFNQWGSLVFRSTGYGTPWDGKYNGEPAPAGTYYFVIDLGDGGEKFNGTVTIIR